jgi:hypothetical protein
MQKYCQGAKYSELPPRLPHEPKGTDGDAIDSELGVIFRAKREIHDLITVNIVMLLPRVINVFDCCCYVLKS